MAWAAVGGAVAGSLVSGAMSKGGGGGASQTASKEPWAEAAPWLKSLLSQGQDLSSYYTNNPFNAAQTQAYGNMANQGAYMRSLVPSLLGQVSGQPLSFDPGNPSARPQAYQFGGGGLLGGDQSRGPNLGLLSGGGMNPVNTMPAKMPTAPTAAPVAEPEPQPGTLGYMMKYGNFGVDYTGAQP